MGGGEGAEGWWSCLWGTLTIVSLCLGVAALWLPLDRHTQLEERLAEAEGRHQRTLLTLHQLVNSSAATAERLAEQAEERSAWRTKIQRFETNYTMELEALRARAQMSANTHVDLVTNLEGRLQGNYTALLDSLQAAGRQETSDEEGWRRGLREIERRVEGALARLDGAEDRVAALGRELGAQADGVQEWSVGITRDINQWDRRLAELEQQGSDREARVEERARGLMDNITALAERADSSLAGLRAGAEGRAAALREELAGRREELEGRLAGLEGRADWEPSLRALVLRVNQFQQLVLTSQKLPQQLLHISNRVKRLERKGGR